MKTTIERQAFFRPHPGMNRGLRQTAIGFDHCVGYPMRECLGILIDERIHAVLTNAASAQSGQDWSGVSMGRTDHHMGPRNGRARFDRLTRRGNVMAPGRDQIEAHQSHFYQRLVGLGYNHAQVASLAAAMTLCLSIYGSFVIYKVGPGWLWITLGLVILGICGLTVRRKEWAYQNQHEEH